MSVEKIVPIEKKYPKTALGLLKFTAREISLFDELAHDARYSPGSAETFRGMVRAKAEILLELPTKLKTLSDEGINVPDEVTRQVSGWAKYAEIGIEKGNYHAMANILTPMGSKKDEPNELEKLIEQMENPH